VTIAREEKSSQQNSSDQFRWSAILLIALVQFFISTHSLAQKFESEHVWMEGRGRIQYLLALQNSRININSDESIEKNSLKSKKITDCVLAAGLDDNVIDACGQAALEAAVGKIDGIRRGQLVLLSEKFLKDSSKGNWQSWLKLSSALALANEAKAAKRLLENAEKRATSMVTHQPWILRRLQLYRTGLEILSSKDDAFRRKLIDDLTSSHDDEVAVREIKRRLSDAVQTELGAAAERSEKPEDRLNRLRYKHWQIEQDRDEVQAISEILEENDLEVDVISRIDLLARQYSPDNSEWRGILNIIAQVTTGVELLARNRALQLPMENWIINARRAGTSLESDEDRTIAKSNLIVLEYATLLGRILSKTRGDVENSQTSENWRELEKRLVDIVSPLAQTINSSFFERDVQAVQKLQLQLAAVDNRLRRSNALLASYFFKTEFDAAASQNIRNIRAELIELEMLRREALVEFFTVNTILEPRTRLAQRALFRTIAQLKKTLFEIRNLYPKSAVYQSSIPHQQKFIIESEELISKIESQTSEVMSKRKVVSQKLVSTFQPIEKEVALISGLARKFIQDAGNDLKPRFKNILGSISADLVRQNREIDLETAIAKTEIQDSIKSRKESLQWTRDRIEDLRRIRSENLYWRIAQ
jgi:hypothetical protein